MLPPAISPPPANNPSRASSAPRSPPPPPHTILATCTQRRRTGRGLEREEAAERRGLVDGADRAPLHGALRRSEVAALRRGRGPVRRLHAATTPEPAAPVVDLGVDQSDKPVSGITSADLLHILAPTWHAEPETARRVRQRIGAGMNVEHRRGDDHGEEQRRGRPGQKSDGNRSGDRRQRRRGADDHRRRGDADGDAGARPDVHYRERRREHRDGLAERAVERRRWS